MNAYYDNFNYNISDSRIIEGYFEELEPVKTIGQRVSDAARALLASTLVRRFAKPVSLALSLVGVAGIIGAVERGRMGAFAGLLFGLLLVGFESLALRSLRKEH